VSLASLSIPASVTSIGEEAFVDCMSLPEISVDPLNSTYSSVNGVLFDKSQTRLLQYPGAREAGDYTAPEHVTSIADRAFRGCGSLTNINLGSALTSIGAYAFQNCGQGGLRIARLPNTLTNIGVINLTIPETVTELGSAAFFNCANLSSVTIGRV
jgi:hypothetical protein